MKDVRLGGLFLFFGTLAFLAPEMALAAGSIDTMGDAADSVSSNMAGVYDIISGMAYLIGAMFGVKTAIQLRDNTENPSQTKLSKPLVSMTVATAMLALPGVIGMFSESLGLGPGGSTGLLSSLSGVPANASSGCGGMGAFQAGAGAMGGGSASQAAAGGMDHVLCSFKSSIPGIMGLINLSALAVGAFLIIKALLLLPQLEQGRVEGGKILWMLASGVALWSILPMISVAFGTLGMGSFNASSTSNILTSQFASSANGSFDKSISSVLAFVQMIGLIAFFRGTLILKAMGDNKDGSMGRALTHIMGGAAAMNITWTVGVLAKSIGFQGTICGLSQILCS